MWSTWDRLTAVSTSGPAGSEEEDDPDFAWGFSGLSDPSAMQDFTLACDHCLSGCSDDDHSLDGEGYGPSRECFHIDQRDHDEGNHLGMPGNDDPPSPASRVEIPRELAVVRVPAGDQDTQLEQLREMQAKLDKETGQLVQFRQDIKQERAGRALARGTCPRARDIQRRIIDDARAGLPPAASRAGQDLAAVAMLQAPAGRHRQILQVDRGPTLNRHWVQAGSDVLHKYHPPLWGPKLHHHRQWHTVH
jgi:hypothetical protein